MKRTFLLAIVLLMKLNVYAYDNEKVHQLVNENAALQSSNFISSMRAGGFKGDSPKEVIELNEIYGKKIKDWFHEGAKLEDETVCRSRNHFHDPLKQWDSAGLNNVAINTFCFGIGEDFSVDSSIIWAQKQPGSLVTKNYWSWPKARNYYYKALTATAKDDRETNFAYTFRTLGQVMHLIADSSVPAHVRNDIHVFPLTIPLIGIEMGKQTYESWAKKNYYKLNYTGMEIVQSIFTQAVFNSLAPVPISVLWDQNKYTGTNPSVTWTTNPSISGFGLAEYTNANFFSEDTIFKDYPHPKKENTTAKLVEQAAKDGKTDKVWYIQGYTSERLAAYSYLNKWLLPDKWTYNLDSYVYQDYASQLIPRAAGYSAGLLNYFFRGDINMVPDDATGTGYVIENKTDEDMNGTFELWYDNKNDERVRLQSWDLTIGRKSSGNNKSTNINFSPPTDAKESNKYILVFSGVLGNEEDAIAGRMVELKEIGYLFLFNQKWFMYQLISVIQLFEIKISNGSYQLTPVEREINIEGIAYEESGASVQSNNLYNKHFVTRASWLSKIGQWGVDSGTLGCYRPENFEKNAIYKYFLSDEDLPDGWNKYCTGRHNFTVQDSILETHSETVAGKHGDNPRLYGKGQDGWKSLKTLEKDTDAWNENGQQSEVSCNTQTSGSLGGWFWGALGYSYTGHNYTSLAQCSGGGHLEAAGVDVPSEKIYTKSSENYHPNYKASIGQGKALMLSTRNLMEGHSERNVILGSKQENKTTTGKQWYLCITGGPQQSADFTGNATTIQKYFLAYSVSNNKRTIETKLKIGDYEVDNASDVTTEESLDMDEDLNEGVWITYETYIESSSTPITPPCPSSWYPYQEAYFSETMTENYDPIPKKHGTYSRNGGILELVDYDNLDGDESFICIYSKSNINSFWSWTEGDESESSQPPATETIEYFLAYKLKGSQIINKVDLGQKIKYTSCQINDKNIVYTYIVEGQTGDKRVIGIINTSDNNLPIGYRQEFELDFSGTSFDPKQLSAIGVTK